MNPESAPESEGTPRPPEPADVALVRGFVEHWGVMARSWGINASMGEMFALLYVTGDDWTAEDLRDRLRVLEQRVNASALDDEEKVAIQQYITRVYGSLTSFNVLFKQPKHAFTGERIDA